MFSRLSRYRLLPDVTSVDVRGRLLQWKSLRLLPDAPGTFLHTVEDADRLDHLAFKYYGQPRDWWRIADANPGFLSPQALLGKEPRTTLRIPVAFDGADPPWPALVRALAELPGVERARAGTPEQPYAVVTRIEGPPLFDLPGTLAAALDASAAAQSLAGSVSTALVGQGVVLTAQVRIAKPDAATWIVAEPATRRVLTLRRFGGGTLIRVFGSGYQVSWVVEATYDTTALAAADLLARVEAEGFAAGPPQAVGRTGKPVVVPPRRT